MDADMEAVSGRVNRRQMLLGVAALLAFARSKNAVASVDVKALLARAQALGLRVRSGEVGALSWQEEIERLWSGVDVAAIAQAIELDVLLAGAEKVELGASVVAVPAQSWLPAQKHMAVKIFAFEGGRANPPHTHDNMVSMHLVLRGRFRVRHFERVRDEKDHVVVRPTIDRVLGLGEATTISDARDNAHWHLALERGVLLDILATNVDPRRAPTDTHLFDPEQAAREGVLLRAPRITSVKEALRRFG